jgi:hypothetical protein
LTCKVSEMVTSYSRRCGDYLYDITVHEGIEPGMGGPFYALLVNLVHVGAGEIVDVTTGLRGEYGLTAHQAVSKLERAVAEWARATNP